MLVADLIVHGKEFHSRGPATLKARDCTKLDDVKGMLTRG